MFKRILEAVLTAACTQITLTLIERALRQRTVQEEKDDAVEEASPDKDESRRVVRTIEW